MSSYQDWLFFVPAILAIIFMIWVLVKFTQQLASLDRSNSSSDADSRYLQVVTAARTDERRGSVHQF